jgi:hypothetical protein
LIYKRIVTAAAVKSEHNEEKRMHCADKEKLCYSTPNCFAAQQRTAVVETAARAKRAKDAGSIAAHAHTKRTHTNA